MTDVRGARDDVDRPDEPQITLRSLAPSAFLPALTYEAGIGAIYPVVALTALHLGASVSMAALLLALLGVGQVIGDVPASVLANRIGDRRAMIAAAALGVVAYLGCVLVRSLVLFGVALLMIGVANATFYLARQSYLTELAPPQMRARVMSTLAGSHRVGLFLGPFLGAGAISLFGLHAAFAVAMVTSSATVVLLVVVPDVPLPDGMQRPVSAQRSWTVFVDHRHLFVTMGSAMVMLSAVRAVRQTVLPLWAGHLGISAEATSLVFGIAGGIELLFFYPSGKVMDRWGRLAVAVPSTVLLGVAIMMLPLTGGLTALTAVAVLMGVGSGIGAGIQMTLGADIAPPAERVRFLGIWRLFSDSGNAAGPVVVSVVASLWTLAAAMVVVGSAGLLSALGFLRWTPRYSPFATPASTRAHRTG